MAAQGQHEHFAASVAHKDQGYCTSTFFYPLHNKRCWTWKGKSPVFYNDCFYIRLKALFSHHSLIKTAEGKPLHSAPHCSKAQTDSQRKNNTSHFKNSKDHVRLTFPRKGYYRPCTGTVLVPRTASLGFRCLGVPAGITTLHLRVPLAAAPWGREGSTGEGSGTFWRTQPPQPS